MKKLNLMVLFFGIIIMLFGCRIHNKLNVERQFMSSLNADSNMSIAIMPPWVMIEFEEKVSKDSIEKLQKMQSLLYQKAIYDWMIGAKIQGKINKKIVIQDIDSTNKLLKKTDAGYLSRKDSSGIDEVVSAIYILYIPHNKMPYNRGLWWIFRKKSVGFLISVTDIKTNKPFYWFSGQLLQLNGNTSRKAIINESMDKTFNDSSFPYREPSYIFPFDEWPGK